MEMGHGMPYQLAWRLEAKFLWFKLWVANNILNSPKLTAQTSMQE